MPLNRDYSLNVRDLLFIFRNLMAINRECDHISQICIYFALALYLIETLLQTEQTLIRQLL